MSMTSQNMSTQESQGKHEVRVATIHDHNDWVNMKAREIDLDKELQLVRDLDGIMRHFRELHTFVGVSSNNIYWTRTMSPVRQILIPTVDFRYISLMNPRIISLEGDDIRCIESCGSIPGEIFVVKRKPYVFISGYTLERRYVELEYGSRDFDPGGECVLASYGNKAWIVQHEVDHLEGITIKNRGTKVNISHNLYA
ncbi:MAG: hypothetical protein FJ139_03980 [Deltaproteobacteria bacterium]|nr:hypothetical protein [Deltaproteobacteria bacterium]